MIFLEKIKRLILASERLDSLVYLNSDTVEQAFCSWFDDLINDLTSTVTAFSRLDYEAIAGVIDMTERVLERENKEFLDRLVDFVQKVEDIFSHKSVQYAQICKKFAVVRDIESDAQKLLNMEGYNFLHKLEHSLSLINRFSVDRLKDTKKRKVHQLANYKGTFERLAFFSTLTRPALISLLKSKGEI